MGCSSTFVWGWMSACNERLHAACLGDAVASLDSSHILVKASEPPMACRWLWQTQPVRLLHKWVLGMSSAWLLIPVQQYEMRWAVLSCGVCPIYVTLPVCVRWEEEPCENGAKSLTLQHYGPMFPDPYLHLPSSVLCDSYHKNLVLSADSWSRKYKEWNEYYNRLILKTAVYP